MKDLQWWEDHVRDTKGAPASDMAYCALGIAGEAGEVADLVKKRWRDGVTAEFHDDLMSELGDVMWYVTAMALLKGWSLEEVMIHNKTKLMARRKEGRRIG